MRTATILDPIEKLLPAIPYLALEAFKDAWNNPDTQAVNVYAPSAALVKTWQALQVAARKACSGLNVKLGHPAWPGPVRNGNQPTRAQVQATGQWLIERLPTFEVARERAQATSGMASASHISSVKC
jgi:hypothetical protein